MATSETLDLGAYMSNSIRTIMAKAYKSVLSNPREAKFAFRMQTLFQKSEKRRRKMLEQEGLEVPPFLISSISTTCNLHCKGCYARSNGIAEDVAANQKDGTCSYGTSQQERPRRFPSVYQIYTIKEF